MNPLEQKMQRVFQEVFDRPELRITPASSPQSIAGWDSLAQMNLIMGLEEEFDVKFSTRELTTLHSVADFKQALEGKGIG